MDILWGLVEALITLIVLGVIVVAMAALFMIVFGIATGIDDRIQG